MTNYPAISYLDNAATTPMPAMVLDEINKYYATQKVNVHRGMYQLANQVTNQYENVRTKISKFIKADEQKSDIIFTSGTTESLNLVAFGYGLKNLTDDDEIVVSIMDHHSNIVPWQQVAKLTGARLRFVELTNDGHLNLEQLKKLLNSHTKIVSLPVVSNVLGTYTNFSPITHLVHQKTPAIVIADAAQSVGHLPTNVTESDVDFLAFSGHKMFGPTGIGVLYGKKTLLKKMNPTKFGGEMIETVNQQTATFQDSPFKFEAGTPNIAGVLGLGKAIDYLNQQGLPKIVTTEMKLMEELVSQLKQIPGIKIYGSQLAKQHHGVVSFNYRKVHAHDVATILDSYQVAVRAGNLCAEPLINYLKVNSVVRVSLTFQNNKQDISRLVMALRKVSEIL